MAKKQPTMPIEARNEAQPTMVAPPAEDLAMRARNEMAMIDVNNAQQDAIAQKPKPIGEKEIIKATEILNKYKSGKANLEKKLIANEEFWKMRQWRYSNNADPNTFHPATAWLWSCIQSRHADIMDSYPTCNFLPRQEDDKAEAQKLSEIVPVILQQNEYESVYADATLYFLKQGGMAQGIFWDGNKNNGLGDIKIAKVDLLSLFWSPAIKDIQDSPHLFYTELVDNDLLEQRYPQTKGKLSGAKTVNVAKYIYDDTLDTSEKSVVVDWYYKKEVNGRRTVHLVKYVNNIVLYATENDTEVPMTTQVDEQTGLPISYPAGESLAERGLYDHGLYPFVMTALFPVEGSLCGYGLTDIGRDAQVSIDIMSKAILDNTVVNSKPRAFIRNDGTVNEEEFLNTEQTLVHCEGSVDETNIRFVNANNINGTYLSVLQAKIDELKYTTSNQDVNNGIATSGITAGSAIASLQEVAGKNARNTNLTVHRAFKEVVYQVVELIRQFYDIPRTFRIAPDIFTNYDNSGLVAQQQSISGQNMGLRLPVFDIEITTEKASPYKKMERNELALNFYQQGFFNPQMADQALSCIEMMDFDKKDDVEKIVKRNSLTQQMLLQFEQIALTLAQKHEPALVPQISEAIMMSGEQMGIAPQAGAKEINLDGSEEEHPFVERARQNARESTIAE